MQYPEVPTHFLLEIMHGVLSGEPGFPKIIAAPICDRESQQLMGCFVTLSFKQQHDPQVAKHFKALLERLLEIGAEDELPEQQQMMRNAIAACQSANEPSIKIL
jgi:hypothetical protein